MKMFKIAALIISIGIAATGGHATNNQHDLKNGSNASIQNSTSTTLQGDINANIQDSSDLFFSANGNTNLDIDANAL